MIAFLDSTDTESDCFLARTDACVPLCTTRLGYSDSGGSESFAPPRKQAGVGLTRLGIVLQTIADRNCSLIAFVEGDSIPMRL